ncbi:MAG: hypothetical protein R2682_05375 [Pyrinomonadaceae bacterium]
MKLLSEKKALEDLAAIRARFAARIKNGYEHAAKDCLSCETKGACCLDAHFVNVRVSRLEAAAMRNAIGELPPDLRKRVAERTAAAIERYGLRSAEDADAATYACPLFEPGIGCLVHSTAKPLPCISHACYERQEDLPPDEILDSAELAVANLNRRVYGKATAQLSIPLALESVG